MLGYFKKLFSILLAAVVIVATVAPSDTVAATRPARPVFKVVKRARKSVNLKINKTRNATGYQIFLSNSRNGKYKQVAASRIRTVKITKLKKKRVYYVKIRAFKTVGYHITYGQFSKIVKIDKYSKKKPGPDVPTGSAIGEIDVPTGPAIGETDVPSDTLEPEPLETQEPTPEQMQVPDMDYYIESPKDILA